MSAAAQRVDRPSPHRRAMIAKVHIARQQLGLTEDDYRAVMLRVVGQQSASDCTDRELEQLLGEFQRQGFRSTSRPSGPRPADHPTARKARALWISLHQLGAIDDASETALEAFARRQLGCDRLQWANQQQTYKLVEALKAIAERHGWSQTSAGLRAGAITLVLKRRLVDAILVKLRTLGIVPESWSAERAGFRLTGASERSLLVLSAEELDELARGLGAKLRKALEKAQ